MRGKWQPRGIIFTLLVAACGTMRATTFKEKTDNGIICLDLFTGEELWSHWPSTLSDAHFELHESALIAFPHYDRTERTDPIVLDPRTGVVLSVNAPPTAEVLARSQPFWPPPDVRLENGWRLVNFSPGNTTTIEFSDPRSGKIVWSIPSDGYPNGCTSSRDTIFIATKDSSEEPVVRAFLAGANDPLWTVRSKALTPRETPYELDLHIQQERLFVQSRYHVFELSKESGSPLLHLDLCKDLNLTAGDFFRGGVSTAAFADAGAILLLSFENRTVAYHLQSQRYLWHLEPGTFPEIPFPAARNGRVWLTAGQNRKLHRVHHWTDHLRALIVGVVAAAGLGLIATLTRRMRRHSAVE